ncbi:hypothetical protein TSUD_413930 [Trifolium subterraneum]|uniref:Uncharacterized protein n=1 Tax=Trifolium subterraneum TaxID=3900 RepID=A0A2Z6P527_TRISU|nr:hypothetical protein TSUD_413930 [Trifolium subterraneum]
MVRTKQTARRAPPFHNPSPIRPSFRQNNPSDEPLNLPALQTIFPPHFQQHRPPNLNQTPPHLKPKVKKKQPSSSLPTRRSQRILSGVGKSQSNAERIYITCETTDEEGDDPKKYSSSSTPKSSKTLSESSPNSSSSSEKIPSPKSSKPFSDKDKGKNVPEEAEAQPKKRFRQKSINELVKDRTPLFGKADEKRFLKKWRTRPIAAGRLFNLQALERHELDLKYYTDYQGWSHFLQIKETYYPRLVQTFFYQAHCDNDTNTIRSIVKGVEIVLDVEFIAKFFKLPTDGLKSYGSNWYSQANVTIDELGVTQATTQLDPNTVLEPLLSEQTISPLFSSPQNFNFSPLFNENPQSNFFNSSSQNIFDQPFFNDILNPPPVTTIPPMQAMSFMNDAGPSNPQPQPQPMPNLPRSKIERNTERIKRDIKKLFQGQQLIDNHLSYITMENSIMRAWFRNVVCYLYNLPYPEHNPYPPPVHVMPQPSPSSSSGDSTPTNQEP